jgi:hypothetical protein
VGKKYSRRSEGNTVMKSKKRKVVRNEDMEEIIRHER